MMPYKFSSALIIDYYAKCTRNAKLIHQDVKVNDNYNNYNVINCQKEISLNFQKLAIGSAYFGLSVGLRKASDSGI